MPKKSYQPELTDLSEITRDSDKLQTAVFLLDEYNRPRETPWLIFGQAQLNKSEKYVYLQSYLKDAVDVEHDSAHALRLPLIGLTFDQLSYHQTHLIAWVDPNNPDDFHVPRPGYNPMKHPEACVCDLDYCKEDPKHIVIPEGFYVPPFDPELYEAVKGKKLEIVIGFREKYKE